MGRQRTGRVVQPLTNAELTQGFLLHEEQLPPARSPAVAATGAADLASTIGGATGQ